MIYKGKRLDRFQLLNFPADFCLSSNPKHWSNEEETIRLLVEVIRPYLCKVNEELGLPIEQKSLRLWDAFRAQSANKVLQELERLNIVHVMVPRNMTHLLQPLDLTTNVSMKKMDKQSFSAYMKKMDKQSFSDYFTLMVSL